LERLKRRSLARPRTGPLSNGYRIRGMPFPSLRAPMPAKRRGNPTGGAFCPRRHRPCRWKDVPRPAAATTCITTIGAAHSDASLLACPLKRLGVARSAGRLVAGAAQILGNSGLGSRQPLPFAIVVAEPIDKVAYADFNGSHRPVSGVLLQFADIGEGIGHVSRLHR